MQVLDVLIGKPEATPAKSGLTGHFKKPVSQAEIIAEGVCGDHIMDRRHHGGVDQAVYIFGDTDRAWWADHLKRDVPPGYFGENLLISDLETANLALGDIFAIGDVSLQVTSPRIPCATYAAHIGSSQAIKDFFAAARPGAYARTLAPGVVQAEDPVIVVPFDGERITLAENMAAYLDGFGDPAFLRRALTVPAHHKLHELARDRLSKG